MPKIAKKKAATLPPKPQPKFTVQWTTRMGIAQSQAVGSWQEALEWLRGFGDRSDEGVSAILITFIG